MLHQNQKTPPVWPAVYHPDSSGPVKWRKADEESSPLSSFVPSLPPDQRLRDLRDQTYDGLYLKGVDFSGADMRGANLSDVYADGCRFCDANFVDVCCADSLFVNCDFSGARFGVVMLAGAQFIGCRFAGVSALSLPWVDCTVRDKNIYKAKDGEDVLFDDPPVVMVGLRDHIAWVSGHMIVNNIVQNTITE
jgi:hypothetical protein